MAEALAVTIEHLLACRYVSAAGLIALLYDHLLTFDQEVEFIWKAKWDWVFPKILFLINRYMVPSGLLLQAYVMSGFTRPFLSDNPRSNSCKSYFSILIVLGITSIAISNFLVLLRLWVLWDHNRRFIRWTSFAFITTQIAAITTTGFVLGQVSPLAFFEPMFHTCYVAKKINISGLWIPGIIFEVMIFITTCWNAFARPRNVNTALTHQLYRDGFSYFLVLFVLRIINLTLAVAAPLSLALLGVFFIWSTSNITTTRLILNCRRLELGDVDDDDRFNSPTATQGSAADSDGLYEPRLTYYSSSSETKAV